MAIPLLPDPTTLGLVSPAVGPWFSTAITLQAPAADLSVSITFAAGTDWYPPAGGLLSLFLARRTPTAFATMRNARGESPFTSGELVAAFRLLPEVEERLQALMPHLPPPDSPHVATPPARASASTRARVRWLALAFPSSLVNVSSIWSMVPDPKIDTSGSRNADRDKLRYVGLDLTREGVIENGDTMADFKRPGSYTPPWGSITGTTAGRDVLLHVPSGDAKLWAFDANGHAIDPGAVAAWWDYLARQVYDPTLWAPGAFPASTPAANQHTCVTAPQLTVHLVNPHEGPLAAPLVDERLQVSGATGSGVVRVVSGGAPVVFSFAAPASDPNANGASDPAVDNAPHPRVAWLPGGRFDRELSLFPEGAVAPDLTRDFIRVAAVDVERHLVGQERGHAGSSPTPETKRAADQNRPSTRIEALRSTGSGPVLLTTNDAAIGAMLAVLDVAGPHRLVSSVITRDYGPFPALPDWSSLPGVDLPYELSSDGATVPFYQVHALVGGGAEVGGDWPHQRVLFELHLDAGLAGAWARIWPEGFDFQRAEHTRMAGGTGRVDALGVARAVITLPGNPAPHAPAPPAVNVMILGRNGQRLRSRIYADKRFSWPTPVPGDPVPFAAGAIICETGSPATGPIPSGASVVLQQGGGSWALVDRASLTAAQRPQTLAAKLRAGDIVELTQPAFRSIPDHLRASGDPAPRSEVPADPTDGLAATGASIDRCDRNPRFAQITPAEPFATMERLEIGAATLGGTSGSDAAAALAAVPALSPYHEILPHYEGHPGAPGSVEIHGTGVSLHGPAAIPLYELLRERSAGVGHSILSGLDATFQRLVVRSTPMVAAEAVVPLPTPSDNTPGVWASVLRTVARGVESEANGASGLVTTAPALYPFSVADERVTNWINNNVRPMVAGLPASGATTFLNNLLAVLNGPSASIARALDRHVKAGAYGSREAARSLAAAMRRAESFVYLETPAFDHQPCGPITQPPDAAHDDPINVIGELITRLGERPGLRVLVCAPIHLLPGTPKMMEDVRNSMLLEAMNALRSAASSRVAVFSPATGTGRTLRIASTTVIIDDAWALTGTTHLSRRGLSFDSSIAVSVFDDVLEEGRPREIRRFRRELVAGRLGLPLDQLPADFSELVDGVNQLLRRGSARLSVKEIEAPAPPSGASSYPTTTDKGTWNRNGGLEVLDFEGLIETFLGAIADLPTETIPDT